MHRQSYYSKWRRQARKLAGLLASGTACCGGTVGYAQDSYEIQVYGSETVPTGQTMFELHSNYTINGQRDTINGVYPSEHAFHETLEITHGFTPWFETGFYGQRGSSTWGLVSASPQVRTG